MAEITNLNRYKKRKRLEEKAQSALENRARFGRTANARKSDIRAAEKQTKLADGHRRDESPGHASPDDD